MAGELIAIRRAATGIPTARVGRAIDRQRVNLGGTGTAFTSQIYGTTVDASATPHTKGAWFELITSTPHASETLILKETLGVFTSLADTGVLCDIGLGGAGSEVVLIPNLSFGFRDYKVEPYVLPIAIPAGVRVAARIQATVASDQVRLSASIQQAGDHSSAPTSCVAYGPDTATSLLALPTNAVSTNVKAAWTQLSASTTADISRIVVGISGASNNFTASTGEIDIGVGAAASEVVVIPDIEYQLTSTEEVVPRNFCMSVPFTVNIPGGSRLSFRYASTSTAALARPTVAVYGFN